MRVAIDLLAVRSWGMKNYTAGVLPALAALAPASRFLVFLTPEIAALVRDLVPANMEIQTVRVGLAQRLLWEQTILPIRLRRWRADVLFATFDIAPVLSPCPVLLAVRNPSPALMGPEGGSKTVPQSVAAHVHRLLSYVSCRRSRMVFYPTAFAADLLGDIMRVPASKRRVVFHGTDCSYFTQPRDGRAALEQYGLERQKYVLYVSGFYPYKHPEVLVDAFHTFVQSAGRGFKLVLVGADLLIAKTKRVAEDRLRAQVSRLGLENDVIFAGQVPREHLAILYQQAAAFVLPTVMETFGLIFVEAMASSVPVICADMGFAREVCGDAALYFPPGDRAALAVHLAAVAHGGAPVDRMIEAGRARASAFSWRREAEGTLALLTEVVNGRAPAASPSSGRSV